MEFTAVTLRYGVSHQICCWQVLDTYSDDVALPNHTTACMVLIVFQQFTCLCLRHLHVTPGTVLTHVPYPAQQIVPASFAAKQALSFQEAAMTALQVSNTLEAASSSSASKLKQQQASLAGAQAAPLAPPVSASEALLRCAERVCSPAVAGFIGHSTAIGLLQDVASLVQHGKSVVILVLNDLRNLFAASQDVLANTREPASMDRTSDVQHTQGCTSGRNRVFGNSNKDSAAAKKQVKHVLRKLRFLLSWANELPSSVYNELLQSVVVEMEQHASVLPESHSSDQIKLDPFVQSTLTNRAALLQKPFVIEEI